MVARTTLRSYVAIAQQANRTTVLAVVGKFRRAVRHQGNLSVAANRSRVD